MFTGGHNGQGEACGAAPQDRRTCQKGRASNCGAKDKAQGHAKGNGEAEDCDQAAPPGRADRQARGTSSYQGRSGAFDDHRDVSPGAPDPGTRAGYTNGSIRDSSTAARGRPAGTHGD